MSTVITHVEVVGDGPGNLIVRWEFDGPPVGVDVAVGTTPEALDHVRARTVGSSERETRLEELGPGRQYVSVNPSGQGGAIVAAERRVPFEGVRNFRDLGGYPALAGSRTRWGVLFRADSLHALTAADLALYERLGLRAVYDFRGEGERSAQPSVPHARHLPLFGPPRPASAEPAGRPVRPQPVSAEEGESFLRAVYLRMLRTAGHLFGELLGGLAAPDGLPAVFHCANGKDRTGLSAALLLDLLGVPRGDILDDYELTGRYLGGGALEPAIAGLVATGVGPDAAAAVMGTPRAVMAAALEAIDTTYGGIWRYLTEHAGLTADHLGVLRERLVT